MLLYRYHDPGVHWRVKYVRTHNKNIKEIYMQTRERNTGSDRNLYVIYDKIFYLNIHMISIVSLDLHRVFMAPWPGMACLLARLQHQVWQRAAQAPEAPVAAQAEARGAALHEE